MKIISRLKIPSFVMLVLMLFSCSKDLPFFEELGLTTISLMGDEEGDDPDALTPLWDAFLAWMNGESSNPHV